MSHVTALYHIVITTHGRERTLPTPADAQLYKYISGIIAKGNSKLIAINGDKEHIHMLVDLNPSLSLASFVRDIKRASSLWIGEKRDDFPHFGTWSRGYYAASISSTHKEAVQRYIGSQKEHHSRISADDEFSRLLERLIYQHD